MSNREGAAPGTPPKRGGGASASDGRITRLLHRLADGSAGAWDELTPLVYDELRKIARAYRRREPEPARIGLRTTAIVHDAYLKLVAQDRARFKHRAHFYAVAAQAMRRILVDRARRRRAEKRGGDGIDEPLEAAGAAILPAEAEAEVVAVDQALHVLARRDPRQARIVVLKYFGGMTGEEIAEVLGIGSATVTREWRAARAWLRRELAEPDPEAGA